MSSSTRRSLKLLVLAIGASVAFGCAAPRSVTESGRVTPFKKARGGMNYSLNIATQTSEYMFDGLESAVDSALAKEVPVYDVEMENLSKAAVAYSLDPIGLGMEIWLRYGVYDRFDIGYKYAAGVHALDARFQFLGPVGEEAETYDGMNASVGLQYSQQTYELPGPLGKLQSLVGYEAKRKDILVPLVISHSIGPNQLYGAFSYGVALNYTMLDYGFQPVKTIEKYAPGVVDAEAVAPLHGEASYLAYGGFFNLRLGYKHFYAVVSTALYYQDYGTFQLLDGGEVELEGWTIVPTVGLEGGF